jgi:primosomal protein N'
MLSFMVGSVRRKCAKTRHYRGVMGAASSRVVRAALHRLMDAWVPLLEQLPGGRAVRWSLDVDPIDLF